jgi:Domain of unknown function (DUF4333)
MTSHRACLLALAAAAATAAGCGATRTDVSEGVDQLNERVLAPQGAKLDCPQEVDGGEGATFECTMRSTTGDASAPVEMRIETEGGELAVAVANDAQFDAAIEKVGRRQ